MTSQQKMKETGETDEAGVAGVMTASVAGGQATQDWQAEARPGWRRNQSC